MSTSEAGVRYSRAVPDEWDGLLADAKALIASNDEPVVVTIDNAKAMLGNVFTLNSERLEANRYYALGLYMCELAKCLFDPEQRDRIIEETVGNVVTSHRNARAYDEAGLRPVDITNMFIQGPVSRLSVKASEALDPDVKLLSDSLSLTAGLRTRPRSRHLAAPGANPSELPIRLIESVTTQTFTAGAVGSAALAAATGILRTVLEKHYLTPDDPMQQDQNVLNMHENAPGTEIFDLRVEDLDLDHTFGPVIDPEFLGGIDLHRAATGCARMRRDEFTDMSWRAEKIRYRPSEPVKVDVDFLKQEPPALQGPPYDLDSFDNEILLHQPRLGCPALHVQGLVGLVSTMVPEIFARAQTAILAEQEAKRLEGQDSLKKS